MKAFRERVFPLLSGVLWTVFLLLDLTLWANSTWIKFAAICLCMAAAWTEGRTSDGRLVAVILSLTVCADMFLLVLDRSVEDQLAGVRIFLAVQLLYAFRLYLLRGKRVCPWGAALRLPGLISALALRPHGRLSALAVLYFLNLCVNCAEAFALKASKPVGRFAWGLLLFIDCDLCVGAWNLGLSGDFARVGMWFFYLPSQVLIVLSQDTEGGST